MIYTITPDADRCNVVAGSDFINHASFIADAYKFKNNGEEMVVLWEDKVIYSTKQ